MPQLHDDFAASCVNAVGDTFPTIKLFSAVQAWHIGITLALVADGRRFCDCLLYTSRCV